MGCDEIIVDDSWGKLKIQFHWDKSWRDDYHERLGFDHVTLLQDNVDGEQRITLDIKSFLELYGDFCNILVEDKQREEFKAIIRFVLKEKEG